MVAELHRPAPSSTRPGELAQHARDGSSGPSADRSLGIPGVQERGRNLRQGKCEGLLWPALGRRQMHERRREQDEIRVGEGKRKPPKQ